VASARNHPISLPACARPAIRARCSAAAKSAGRSRNFSHPAQGRGRGRRRNTRGRARHDLAGARRRATTRTYKSQPHDDRRSACPQPRATAYDGPGIRCQPVDLRSGSVRSGLRSSATTAGPTLQRVVANSDRSVGDESGEPAGGRAGRAAPAAPRNPANPADQSVTGACAPCVLPRLLHLSAGYALRAVRRYTAAVDDGGQRARCRSRPLSPEVPAAAPPAPQDRGRRPGGNRRAAHSADNRPPATWRPCRLPWRRLRAPAPSPSRPPTWRIRPRSAMRPGTACRSPCTLSARRR
jgi:hypothetical protein